MSLTTLIILFTHSEKKHSENHLQKTTQPNREIQMHRKYKSNNEQTNISQKTKLKHHSGRILIQQRNFSEVQERF